MDLRNQLFIGGSWRPSSSGETFTTINPADRETLATVARAREQDVDVAVAAARAALSDPRWSQIGPPERGRVLNRIAGLLRERKEELARIESLDCGKPLNQARNDIEVSARYFEFYSGVADKLYGKTIPLAGQYLNYTLLEPIGVTAHITPWNFPLQIACRGIAPALAAGNTVVHKPAEQTPLTALLLGEISLEAGLPAGVLNVVTGFGNDAGARLTSHPHVNHITFTGSVETGRLVMKAAAENIVPVTLELGGKSPNIVLADAEFPSALKGVSTAVFANAGQICSAGTRLVVDSKLHKDFVQQLQKHARSLRIGPGLENPDLGPLISEEQHQRVQEYIKIGKQEGARLLTGGKVPDDPRLRQGLFMEPTLFDEVTPQMRIAQEEIFGPVLAILTFRDLEEALEIANGVSYGLVAGIWTRDIKKAHWLAARLQAGQVFINEYFAGGVETPFGGYKKSGFGREKGLEALVHYTQVKNVCVNIDLQADLETQQGKPQTQSGVTL
ncbi:MAG: aldehyde dehydrogenase family protein [Acidobacteria bacterium]|nr:aldehyde dehydrogenase family protein [Acidobacteriota bacterium]